MKKIVLSILFIAASLVPTYAQDWSTNLEEVKVKANRDNKCILLVFKGSDWCAPCIKLEKNIFSSDTFINEYSSHFILLEADFPRKKKNALSQEQQKQNNKLASIYNKNGHFPLVVVMDSKGNVLGETGYTKLSAQAYLTSLIAYTN